MSLEEGMVPEEESYGQLGEYLTSEYEILRRVFEYLSLNELEVVSEVCIAWQSAAQVTRKRRKLIESYVLSTQKYTMEPVWSEARFCILFFTSEYQEFEDKVLQFLDEEAEVVKLSAKIGVIGTVHNKSLLVQQKIRVGLPLNVTKVYLTALRIPKLADVGYKMCVWEEPISFKQFRDSFDIPDGAIVKCVLIFMVIEDSGLRRNPYLQKDDFLAFLHSRQEEGFAVAGCVVDDITSYTRMKISHSAVKYVVFYGNNVRSSSTVLTSDTKSLTAIQNKLEELKKHSPVGKYGALFVFRCTGRQRAIRRYKPKEDISVWEGNTLLKLFPQIPIVGCCGYGEFGNEFPKPDQHLCQSQSKRQCDVQSCEYSYSTCIAYLAFNNN